MGRRSDWRARAAEPRDDGRGSVVSGEVLGRGGWLVAREAPVGACGGEYGLRWHWRGVGGGPRRARQ
jgi:hypothetical protein